MPIHNSVCTVLLLLIAWAQIIDGRQLLVTKTSPAESRILAARANVKTKPDSASAYNDLAAALCRKGRDTKDPGVYQQAEMAVNQSLRLSKENYEARKLQVTVLLGQHRFAQALRLAQELNHKVPDDVAGWALLVDANIALGNYDTAERQAQWILDLRPGNALGFEKSVELRELFGDLPGAVEFLDEANRRTSSNDADQHAWLLTEKARMQLESGYQSEAEGTVQQALQLFPDSQRAAEVLARIRSAQGRLRESAELLTKRYQAVKTTSNLYDEAQAFERNGQKQEAAAAFQAFEKQAEAEVNQPFNANGRLILFLLERRGDPNRALELATKESLERHDCATLDAYAWALYNNGQYANAEAQMNRALAVGVRDPTYFCHATQIASKAGDSTAAARFEKELLTFKGSSCPGVHGDPGISGSRGQSER